MLLVKESAGGARAGMASLNLAGDEIVIGLYPLRESGAHRVKFSAGLG